MTTLERTVLFHYLSVIPFVFLIASIATPVPAQEVRGVVQTDSLQVYNSLPDNGKRQALGTLAHGTTVHIDWSMTTGQGSWCRVSGIDPPVNLGFVDCNGLKTQTTSSGNKPLTASSPEHQKGSSQQWTRAQKAWGLAASAVLTEFNHDRHDTLAGVTLTEEHKRMTRQTLANWWGIGNREDLLSALTWIEQGGHRQEFSVVGERASQLEPAELKRAVSTFSPEDANSILVAQRYYNKLGQQSITGWDYARYISLCRWGFTAGYLSEEEAWERIMSAARTIQQTFSSWQEFGENYLVGREFWSLRQTRKDGQAMRNAYMRLRQNSSSPWNQIPWNLNLD